MATEVMTPETDYYTDYASSMSAKSFVGQLLRHYRGDFIVGLDGDTLPAGTRLVAIAEELQIGWTRWENNSPAESKMGLLVEGFTPPRRADLGYLDESEWEEDGDGDTRDPWQFGNYLPLVDPETNEIYTFTASSKGSLNCVGELCRAYGPHRRQFPNQYPEIELQTGSYQHSVKAYGRIKFPRFPVIGWVEKGPYLTLIANARNGGDEARHRPCRRPKRKRLQRKPKRRQTASRRLSSEHMFRLRGRCSEWRRPLFDRTEKRHESRQRISRRHFQRHRRTDLCFQPAQYQGRATRRATYHHARSGRDKTFS